MSRPRQKRDLERIAAEYGYTYGGRTTRGHLRWLGPNGALVVTGSELRDACGLANAVAQLRRGVRACTQETRT